MASDINDAYWRAGLRLFGDDDHDDASPIHGVSTLFGDWSTPIETPALSKDIAVQFYDGPTGLGGLDAVLCQLVLHVLSLDQSRYLLTRLAKCTKAGGILVGSCVGAHIAGSWARTPDGRAPRWLFSPAELRQELMDAGWGEVSVIEAPRDETDPAWKAINNRLANLGRAKNTPQRGFIRLQFYAVAPA